MKENRRWINEKTGEIVNESNLAFTEAMNEEGYRIPSHKLGARMFADVQLPPEMSLSDIGAMSVLARHYLVGNSNMLGYREGKEIKAYTPSEIREILRMEERTGQRFIARMQRLRVMQRVQTTAGYSFYVNPAYFMRSGQRLSLDLFLLFRRELTPLLPQWAMGEFLRQAAAKAPLASDAVAEAEEIAG